MTSPLIDDYDAALFDLDGVVYLGPQPVEGASEGIAALRERGVHVGFVTNNAARTPQHVVDHLVQLGIPADVADVVTSAQAVARLMADELPEGSLVLVTGTAALAAELTAVGLTTTQNWRDEPVAVVQGYDPDMTQARLDGACFAIQRGARWYASNTDATRPTDQGLVPGAGSQVASVRVAVEIDPVVAGKPCAPLMHETVTRLGAGRPIFVGDRLDTDIEGANGVDMESLFVFTGAHGKADLAGADVHHRPTHIGHDLRALLAPARTLTTGSDSATCGHITARVTNGRVHLDQPGTTPDEQLDALWAVLALVWEGADGTEALAALDLIP
ncbi:HAD-IIA family hydrolase [Aestuariimicrobium kwangyangense]|uniref:HAD-IIA family hydrolase n=1 Tax=Aestuariimicrobium kwangyangense TaxID=396389 RepID=UPI0003B379CA|nr:HAD-IIA family hydrolase [Aestuariimicrobium kwangyangense]